ncbi:putative reverse transcriptase domain-containing protein [Tanacetum coccineum]
MADNCTMAQMLQEPIEGYEDVIVVPPINANNFELKQPLINLVQSNKFTGRQDPHNHLRFFNKVTSTFSHPEVPNTSVKLLLFPFSLDGEARDWEGYRGNGEDLKEKFGEGLLIGNAYEELVSSEKKKVEAYLCGLPKNIKGETTSSRPVVLNEAVQMAHTLMEQKLQAKADNSLMSAKRLPPPRQGITREGFIRPSSLPWGAPVLFVKKKADHSKAHYEFQVMLFGLTNAPANKEEHKKHLKIILELLKNEQLYAKFSKCDFWLESAQFLGHVIKNKGVSCGPAKVCGIRNMVCTVTRLTQKNKKYEWGTEEDEAFQTLKQKLCSAPILALPEGSEKFVVYYDASHKGYGAVLMQREKTEANDEMRQDVSDLIDCSIGGPNMNADAIATFVSKCLTMCKGKGWHKSHSVYSNNLEIPEWKAVENNLGFHVSRDFQERQVVMTPLGLFEELQMDMSTSYTREQMVKVKRNYSEMEDMLRAWLRHLKLYRSEIGRSPVVGVRHQNNRMNWSRGIQDGAPDKLHGIHSTFHVSNLKKCMADENLVIHLKRSNLTFIEEPVEIMDCEVKQLKQSRIPIVKVR